MKNLKLHLAVAVVIGAFGLLSIAAAKPPVNLAPRDSVIVRCSGVDLAVNRQSATQVTLECRRAPTATPTASLTAQPTSTHTPAPSATPTIAPPTGDVGRCGESSHEWHPPVVNGCVTGHEHGDAPPAWVVASSFSAHFTHPANTPNENVVKHTSFKGFLLRDDGIDVYVIAHIDTNPSGHSSRFHSYQVWARDSAGNVSYWDGWMDFGTSNLTGPQFRRFGCDPDTDSTRPIMAANDEECNIPLRFENWYSRAGGSGGWAWDLGFNTSPNYYAGGDPANPATWNPTGQLNSTRRIELAWYANRSNLRGSFWATQFGDIVSGPADPACGTTRTFGAKTYTVLCLAQYIAPTMQTFSFPGNSMQKSYDMTGVQLPN
jgi:hypothetical protein